MPPEAAVDAASLAGLFGKRRALAQRLEEGNTRGGTPGLSLAFRGPRHEVLHKLFMDFPSQKQAENLDSIPTAYRDFLKQTITGWRGHRLFGLETPPPENNEDLRGQDCLFALSEDPIAGVQMEHFYGRSVWCPRGDMAKGRYDSGQLVNHSNG